MKLTPSSIARRRTAIAAAGSFGGPQIPSPVRRIAPKPRRLTVSSPPSEMVPLEAVDELVVLSVFSVIFSFSRVLCFLAHARRDHHHSSCHLMQGHPNKKGTVPQFHSASRPR